MQPLEPWRKWARTGFRSGKTIKIASVIDTVDALTVTGFDWKRAKARRMPLGAD